MRKIAYFVPGDWNLIKQRSQFLAEKLALFYDIDIFYLEALKSKVKVNNDFKCNFKSINKIKRFPITTIFPCLRKIEIYINKFININFLKLVYETEYEYLWIPSPVILQYIDIKKMKYKKLIYDCMDDVLEFPKLKRAYFKDLYDQEKLLLSKTDIVFVTASKLEELVRQRGYSGKITIVNNGIEPESVLHKYTHKQSNYKKEGDVFNITYIGTISEWFDFELIFKLLKKYNDIEFTIVGPNGIDLPKHEKINYVGPVNHTELYKYAEQADAFIMPFKLNNLVLSVDPIKVYEYIAFMKPTFVVKYPETEKFREYVYLYEGIKDLSKAIESTKNGQIKQPDMKNIKKFIESNNWDTRVQQICKILEQE